MSFPVEQPPGISVASEEVLGGWRTAVIHGAGLARLPTLSALLPEMQLLRPARGRARQVDGVLAWGRKPSARRAEAWARGRGLPVRWLEDGFLRSVELGSSAPPLSIVVDDQGIYYDATVPSRLETLVTTGLDATDEGRALALVAQWRQARVSKYNHAREAPGLVEDGDVLVVDQTFGDASIAFGCADAASFARMLEAALDEHPRARVLLKVHPDVLAGRKRGHFDAMTPGAAKRVVVVASPAHPPGWLERTAAVYTVTSQMGFEALLWNRPVRCFGMPFYAGWGLTRDELPAPARRGAASLAGLAHAALIRYPRYIDPESHQRCEVEHLLDWMAFQRRQRERFPARMVAVGFSRWRRPIARAFLAGSELHFQRPHDPVPADAGLVLWGLQAVPPGAGVSSNRPVVRLEDGFLRSVGLGADLVRPLSWVIDGQGLYYDASAPSGLETLLRETDFTPGLRARAAALRQRIVALGLTKYNLGGPTWARPPAPDRVVLVVGQVESDAAILHGAPGVRTNIELLRQVRQARPGAWLVYKPHPDVVAGLRQGGQGEQLAAGLCDEVLTQVGMHQLLERVDEVHVLTSLAGFEALLRGVRVVTWGCPFYAGWGLTEDRWKIARRDRRLDLDELVAAVLLLYPTYLSRNSGHFTTPEHTLDALEAWQQEEPKYAPTVLKRLQRWILKSVVDLRRRRSPMQAPRPIEARPVPADHQ